MTLTTTGRRETIAALLTHGDLPARMGLNEHFWPHIVDNAWGAQGLEADCDMVSRFDLDLRCVQWHNPPDPRPDLATVVEETAEWQVRRDGWGATCKYWKHRAGTPEHVGFAIASPEIWWRDYRDAFLAQPVAADTDFAAIRAAREAAQAEDRFTTYAFAFVFEQLRAHLGDVVMLEGLMLEKDFIHDVNRCITDHFLAWFEHLFAQAGLPDGIHMYEDLGYTRGPFASPACHREMILPYHREIMALFKDHGLPVIMHTCGDFRPHLPAIVETGVDCIQALEGKTGMDVVALAREWKHALCFMGNFDIRAYESGDRTRIADEIVGKMRGMRELRAPFVAMSDHSIPPSVSLADFEYSLELIRDNWRY